MAFEIKLIVGIDEETKKEEVRHYDVSRSVPKKEGDWRDLLILVSCGGQRFLGLLAPIDAKEVDENRPFVMHMAASYYAAPQIVPTGPGKLGFVVEPKKAFLYDTVAPLATIWIMKPDYAIPMVHQLAETREFYENMYLDLFDPSNLTTEGASKMLVEAFGGGR